MTREKRLKMIADDMVKFGKLPKDYITFGTQTVFKHTTYIFYTKAKKTSYCTGCKTDKAVLDFKKIRHNASVICGLCGRRATAKSEGYSRSSLVDTEWSIYLENYKEELLVSYIRHERDMQDYRNPIFKSVTKIRTVVGQKKSTSYEYDEREWNECWSHYKTMPWWFSIGISKEPIHGAWVYHKDIMKVVKKTYFKYSGLDYVMKLKSKDKDPFITDKETYLGNAYVLENYASDYRKHPYIEKLIKVGLEKLAAILVESKTYETEYIAAKEMSVVKILKLSKDEFNLLVMLDDPGIEALKILYKARECQVRLDSDTYSSLYYTYSKRGQCNDILNLTKYMSLKKAINWADKIESMLSKYVDYIRMAEILNYDLSNDFVLFPRNIEEAHDTSVNEFNSQKKKNTRLKLGKVAKSGIYNFENDKFKIVVPTCSSAIIKEGQALRHCVGSYVDNIAKGETMILFLRKKECPDVPFYTIEWKNNKVIQCYGLKNVVPTEEVALFKAEFEMHMTGKAATRKAS